MKKHLVTLSIVAFASATAFPSGKMGQTYFPSSETNATKALQAAIDAGARTVVLDAGRGDWCIEPIKLRSNLELVFGENALRLTIADNGKGFDPKSPRRGHYGVTTMRERAAKVGGETTIDSAPGQGTRITLELPYLPPEVNF